MHQNRVQNIIKCHNNNIWKHMCIKKICYSTETYLRYNSQWKKQVKIYMWALHHKLFWSKKVGFFFSMYQKMIPKETSWAGPRPVAHGFTIGQIVTFVDHGFVMLTVRMVIYGTLIVAISPMLGSVVPGTVPYPEVFADANSCTGVQGTRGSSGIVVRALCSKLITVLGRFSKWNQQS